MNWLERYSDTAQHCRPQVAIADGAKTGFIAAVEANTQPAEIGFRVSSFDVETGKRLLSSIVVRSDPQNNKYVSEPVIGLIDDKIAITYGLSQKARNRNGANGHAGGEKIDAAVLVNQADLSVVGEPVLGVGQFGRHSSSFVTTFGPDAVPALAVISGSSTGTGKGFEQLYTLKADGSVGEKDPLKVYTVAPYADVANVQARGKRNPNNQARGFINGTGNVPNPGYTADPALAKTNFMPDVRTFSFSAITGYSGADAATKGYKNSIWLSLVPAAWTPGLATVPGGVTDKPGLNEDGNGPAPRTTTRAPRTATTVPASDSGGCSVARAPVSRAGVLGAMAMAVVGLFIVRRRKAEEV
jgi:hypothetical protein